MTRNATTITTLLAATLLLWGCATAPEPATPGAAATAPEPTAEPAQEAPAAAPEPAEEPSLVVYERGDIGPAGGIVFYVDRRNEHEWTYLEAAPAGWHGTDEDPRFLWGEMGVTTGANGSGIGSGSANTALIAEQSGEFAAKIAATLVINGFDDWFLPSLDEIGEMYENLFRRQLGDLARAGYWTSTERTPDRAMVRNFDTAGQISGQKSNENHIRPIRAF